MMRELADNILDIAQNSISARASLVEIDITVDHSRDAVSLRFADDGCGMSAEMAQAVCDPFTTTRKTRKVGLGIPMIKQLCEMCEGAFRIESELGKGTTLHLEFRLSHVDLPPMGDLAQTMTALVIGSPDKPDFRLVYTEGHEPYLFDTASIREVLGPEVPLNTPEVVLWMQDDLREGLAQAATPVN